MPDIPAARLTGAPAVPDIRLMRLTGVRSVPSLEARVPDFAAKRRVRRHMVPGFAPVRWYVGHRAPYLQAKWRDVERTMTGFQLAGLEVEHHVLSFPDFVLDFHPPVPDNPLAVRGIPPR